MRIPIREQLALLVLVTSLVSLAVVAIATWVNNYNFVTGIGASKLSLTASLKATQIQTNLGLLASTLRTISTRIVIQQALGEYRRTGNNSAQLWSLAQTDMDSALLGGGQLGLLVQASFYGAQPNASSNRIPLLNSTSAMGRAIVLPYRAPNGSQVHLGDHIYGYPPMLYPSLTTPSTVYPLNVPIEGSNGTVVALGPISVNQTFALMSMTVPVINNTSTTDVIGYLTVVMSARLITNSLLSYDGLGNTGEALLIGPNTAINTYPDGIEYNGPGGSQPGAENFLVNFVIQPSHNTTRAIRHSQRDALGTNTPFPMSQYPAVVDCITQNNSAINNAGSALSSNNEQGAAISVGYARVSSNMVDWCLLVEEDESEAQAPIVRLRNILLACVFGTAGALLLLVIPMAHFAVRPIQRLKEATERSVDDHSDSNASEDNLALALHEKDVGVYPHDLEEQKTGGKGGLFGLRRWWRGKQGHAIKLRSPDAREFKIPGKVHERKYWVRDELTDLTTKFNEMSDELFRQYTSLEERVQQRTRELEKSKREAEVANESKTLFIANISHELKTPLNGILGMCAVCMGETDLTNIQRSLGIIFKSGDLLLKLLNDLLTFSKNQFGHQLTLDERDFRLADLKVQLLTLFHQQVVDNKIDYRVDFAGPDSLETSTDTKLPAYYSYQAFGPQGTGKIKDMCLRGDQHRISQIMINLVSNALKFTPEGGKVHVVIRCLGWAPEDVAPRRSEDRPRKAGSKNTSLFNLRLPGRSHAADGTTSMPPSPGRSGATTPQPPGLSKTVSQDRISMTDAGSLAPNGSTSADCRFEIQRKLLFKMSVEDSGPGISLDMQQQVFKPFVQGDLGLSKKYGGTGLGLSICSQLAALMKGSVSLKSMEGVGSTFTVQIPLQFINERSDSVTEGSQIMGSRRTSMALADEAREGEGLKKAITGDDSIPVNGSIGPAQSVVGSTGPAAHPQTTRLVGLSQPFFSNKPMPQSPPVNTDLLGGLASAPPPGERIRILVAEDNKVNQEVVLRMLKLEDIFDVTLAKDGQEAYDLVKDSIDRNTPFNLVLMDVQMPVKDGIESTKMIREIGFKSPIVALTAFSEESNKKDCLDSGMDYFLAKPIRRPALKLVLKTYCATIKEEPTGEDNEKSSRSLPNTPPTATKPRPRRTMRKRRDVSVLSTSDPNLEPPLTPVSPLPPSPSSPGQNPAPPAMALKSALEPLSQQA